MMNTVSQYYHEQETIRRTIDKLCSFDCRDRRIMNDTRDGNHFGGRLLRSGTSPALSYSEARAGESKRDFIHKIKVVLKELRETFVGLQIIYRSRLYKSGERIKAALNENMS